MDSAETTEANHERLSINIHAPCNNRIYSGDHIEVHIHSGVPSTRERESQENDGSSESIETAELPPGLVEVLVPKALRIAHTIRRASREGGVVA
jgi:hypothetical protein